MSAAFESQPYPNLPLPAAATFLREMPRLLEYRSEADPDAEFIPKTVAGFCLGFMVFGFCLIFGESVVLHLTAAKAGTLNTILVQMAFTIGITGVAASLLLVGLKVRADHSAVDLFARHWLNSICTGALYSLLIWGPWVLIEHGWGININRFLAAAVWMALMAFPAFAARWTIGPYPQRTR